MVAMEKLPSIKKGVNVVFPFSTQCLDSSTSLGTFTFGGMLC